jgi:uncharacterized protein YbaP (TraB family)
MRKFSLLAVTLLINYCNAQPVQKKLVINKDDNSLLWQISGNGLRKPSYLFGTFHLMCKDDIHFSNQLKQAIANANEVYMELDMGDPSEMAAAWAQMNMKGDKKLKDFYTDSEYKRLEIYFNDSLNMPLAMFQNFKPYFLLAAIYPKMLPCKNISGVEEELVQLAKDDKKKIEGLETMEFQSSVFDSIPYSEQAKDLLQSIDSIDENRKEFITMMNVYKTQQVNKIQGLFEKSEFGTEEHEDILIDNRNRNWIGQLKILMKKESVFVAVGAGHLVGDKGLIALLRKQGYKVQPLLNE